MLFIVPQFVITRGSISVLKNHWTSKTNVILMSCRCGGCDDDHSSKQQQVHSCWWSWQQQPQLGGKHGEWWWWWSTIHVVFHMLMEIACCNPGHSQLLRWSLITGCKYTTVSPYYCCASSTCAMFQHICVIGRLNHCHYTNIIVKCPHHYEISDAIYYYCPL